MTTFNDSVAINLCKSYTSTIQKQLADEKLTLENKLCSYLTVELKPGDLTSLGRAFASLYNCDSSGLIVALGKCCDLLRSKDDSSSPSTRRCVPCTVLLE